jgi:transposase
MIEVETIDALSTIKLLESIEALYPLLVCIHVFLDNARYHHAKLVQEWLSRRGCRIKLHFIPTYCPHLNPIERLWGVMHRNITHNKCYENCAEFAAATLDFLRETRFPGIGPKYAIRSPATFVSFRQRIFGSWGEPGILNSLFPCAQLILAAINTVISPRFINARSTTGMAGRPDRRSYNGGTLHSRKIADRLIHRE